MPQVGRRAHRSEGMVTEFPCPICNADIQVDGDEEAGDSIWCHYCGVPCKLTRPPSDPECELEEDV